MLVIGKGQLAAFEKAAWQRFAHEMVVHSREFSPRLCEVIGEEQLRVALRAAGAGATAYGFTNRGPIRLFIEMMFLFGSGFDTDPQYPVIRRVLRGPGDQMQRAQRIHEWTLEYYEKVSGAGAINVHNALRRLSQFARMQIEFSSGDFVRGMLQEMHSVFPQKTAYVGAEALTALIQKGRAEARRYGFSSTRAEVLIVVLMFAFGHGCTSDPLYPWISQTLKDDRIVDPAARAVRLEQKALTWLEHVNARNEKKTSL